MSGHLTAHVLGALVLIVVAVGIGGRIAGALGQPRVVGEILAGVLIGPTVLGGRIETGGIEGAGLVDWLYPPEAFSFLNLTAQVGLVLYMFIVGIELDRRLLRGRGRQIGAVALATAAAPVALGFVAAPAFAGVAWRPPGVGDTTFALFLAAGLAATALPVMARLLQDKKLMATPVAATSLGVAGLVTVAVFLIVAAASASAKGGAVAGDVAIRLALTVALVLALVVAVRPALARVLTRLPHLRAGPGVFTALIALALASGLAADRIGIHALVGGFLLGLCLPDDRRLAEAVVARIRDVVGLVLLPVFFAVSGLMTDLGQLGLALVPGVLLFIALTLASKWVPGYLAARASGLGGDEANALGVLLSCGGLLVLVVGLSGLELGVITAELQATFVIAAIATLVMAGPMLDRFDSRQRAPAQALEGAP